MAQVEYEDNYRVKVVFPTSTGLYKAILERSEYVMTGNQITLPVGYYSAGYYERIIDGSDWNKLPWLNGYPKSVDLTISTSVEE